MCRRHVLTVTGSFITRKPEFQGEETPMVTHQKYASVPYHAYRSNFLDLGDSTTDIRLALLDSAHTPDIETHEQWSDVSGDEISPTANDGYSGGGQGVDSVALTRTGQVTDLDAADVVWETSTITASYAVLYDADSGYLLTLVDFEGTEESEEGDFSIEWHDDGLFTITTNT